MSGRGFACWECGQPAPGGVCLGPHPNYRHSEAVAHQMVMNLDGIRNAATYAGASVDQETLPARKAYKRRYRQMQRQYDFERALQRERRLAARIEHATAA